MRVKLAAALATASAFCGASLAPAAQASLPGMFMYDGSVQYQAPTNSNPPGPKGVFVGSAAVLMADTPNNAVASLDTATGMPVAPFQSDFVGGGAFTFNTPWKVIDGAAGEILVSDSANHRVLRLSATDGHELGTLDSSSITNFDPHGLALDPNGTTVAVADPLNDQIDLFSPSGPLLGHITGSGATVPLGPQGVAYDGVGNLWVTSSATDRIEEFDSGGNFVTGFGASGSQPGQFASPMAGIAVDNFGNLWVADPGNNRVQWLQSSGSPIGSATTGTSDSDSLAAPSDVSVNPRNGDVWVADTGNDRLAHYTLPPVGAQTDPPSGVSSTSATLHGTVYTNDGPWVCHFEYRIVGTSTFTATSSACAGGNYSPHVTIGPLQPSTQYEYQLVGSRPDGSGSATGPLVSFQTSSGGTSQAPTVATLPADNISESGATLHGTVNPNGSTITQCKFVWGTDLNYRGTPVPCVETVGSGTSTVSVSAQLSGLTPGQTYHFALVAANAGGSVGANDEQFVAASPPVATTMAPSAKSATELDLAGSIIDAGGLDTHYYFQWGTDLNNLNGSIPAAPGTDAGSGATPSAPVQASAALTGLTPNTTYCFRLVASNAAGLTYGHDAGSGTPGTSNGLCAQTSGPPIAPRVVTGAGSVLGNGDVNLGGTVNPELQPTKWFIQYSTYQDLSYAGGGQPANVAGEVPVHDPGQDLGFTDDSPHPVGASVSGLTPGTVYYFRVVAGNATGTTYGDSVPVTYTGPPTASTGTATSPTDYELHFTGTVAAGDDATTTWFFQYSTDSQVNGARDTPASDPGIDLKASDNAPHPVGADGLALTPGTLYYYRLVAHNKQGYDYGTILPVRTTGHAPVAVDAMEVSQVSLSDKALPTREDATSAFTGAGIPFSVPVVSQINELYEHGPTSVRMFAHADVPVAALLYAYDNGKQLGNPIAPRASGAPDLSATPVAQKRTTFNSAYTFDLPSDWTKHRSEGLTLVGTLIPANEPTVAGCSSCNQLNGIAVSGVQFTTVKPLYLRLVEFSDTPKSVPAAPASDQTAELASATALLPSTITTSGRFTGVVDTSGITGPITDSQGNTVDTNTQGHNAFDSWASNVKGSVGMILLALSGDDRFWGVTDGTVSASQIPISNVQTGHGRPLTSIAHELGHAIGLNHASSCTNDPKKNPVGAYDDWPPDQKGFLQGYGLDLRNPNGGFYPVIGDGKSSDSAFYDFMGYCAEVGGGDLLDWVSPRNWNAMISILHTAAGAAADHPAADAAGGGGLVVRAYSSDGMSQIDSVSSAGTVSGRPSSVHVLASDAAGHPLADVPMDVLLSHSDRGSQAQPARPVAVYSARIPAGAASVRMLDGATVLAQRSRTPHAPIVRVLAPAAGRTIGGSSPVAIRWSASDADGDPLRIAVEYSLDGGASWNGIYSGPNRGEVSLPSSLLAASRRARIRITANDGFNETAALSGIFTARGAPPVAVITSPHAGTRVADDAGLDLAGYANDDAGTPLSGRSLRWLDGRRLLGTGGELTVTGLAPGRHTIILEARDRLGRRAVQRVSVAVTAAAPRLIVFSAPARLGPHSRSVRLRLASLVPALARIGRVRRAISSRPVTLVVPVRPGHGRIVLLLTLSSYGKRTRIPVVIVR